MSKTFLEGLQTGFVFPIFLGVTIQSFYIALDLGVIIEAILQICHYDLEIERRSICLRPAGAEAGSWNQSQGTKALP